MSQLICFSLHEVRVTLRANPPLLAITKISPRTTAAIFFPSGDILWQKPFEITFRDDAAKVYEKIKILAGKAIKEFLPELKDSTAKRVAQEHTCATYLRKRNERDGLINWTAKTIETYNLIRGLARPYVGAHTYVGGNKMIIYRAEFPIGQLPLKALDL